MIGKRIKKYRELKNLTQEELADMLYISPKTLGHYETGARDCRKVDLLAALTEILGFSVLIKKGKVYIEEDFKMDRNSIKVTIMRNNEHMYKGVIKELCYGYNSRVTDETKEVINELFNSIMASDVCKTAIDNKIISLESNIYESDEFYFLDLRAFDETKDQMIEAFMAVYTKKDLIIYEEEIDDIWTFADWVEIK